MRPGDRALAVQLEGGLQLFHGRDHELPGIEEAVRRAAFLAQLIESIRRNKYVSVMKAGDISKRRADPNDELFDPLKAAILFQRKGELDEAFWMVFYFVHFGKSRYSGWRYARQVYGCLGEPNRKWDWNTTQADPAGFRSWLSANQDRIRLPGAHGGFGNHRKYQSLDAFSKNGTGAAFETYIEWVGHGQTHEGVMGQALEGAKGNARSAFRRLYDSMGGVASFGRTARFDYLAMVGKLKLASIEPDSTYMQGSTGPLDGARLLFGVKHRPTQLDQWLVELEARLGIEMQVLEDALCNWQKSPSSFKPFRG